MICEEIQFLASRVIGLKINIGGGGGDHRPKTLGPNPHCSRSL